MSIPGCAHEGKLLKKTQSLETQLFLSRRRLHSSTPLSKELTGIDKDFHLQRIKRDQIPETKPKVQRKWIPENTILTATSPVTVPKADPSVLL